MRLRDAQEILASRCWLAEIDPAFAPAVLQAGQNAQGYRGQQLMATFGKDGLRLRGHVARRSQGMRYGSAGGRAPSDLGLRAAALLPGTPSCRRRVR